MVAPDVEASESRAICSVSMHDSGNESDVCVVDAKSIMLTVGTVPPDACTGEARVAVLLKTGSVLNMATEAVEPMA